MKKIKELVQGYPNLACKVFWTLRENNNWNENEHYDLMCDVMQVCALKCLELEREGYLGEEGAWVNAIKNAVKESQMEDTLIRVPSSSQYKGMEPVPCSTNSFYNENNELVVNSLAKDITEDVDEKSCEISEQEIWDKLRWVAAGDDLSVRMIHALSKMIDEQKEEFGYHVHRISDAEIARRIGCDPKTVACRRKRMREQFYRLNEAVKVFVA